jgi:hypothetical protein
VSQPEKPIKYDDFRGALERFAYERAVQAKETGFEHHRRDCVVLDRLLLLFDAGRAEITQALRTAGSRLNRGA